MRDPVETAGDRADAGELEGELEVDAGHQPAGQRDLLVLGAAAVGQVRRPLGVVQRRRLALEVVEEANSSSSQPMARPCHAARLWRVG